MPNKTRKSKDSKNSKDSKDSKNSKKSNNSKKSPGRRLRNILAKDPLYQAMEEGKILWGNLNFNEEEKKGPKKASPKKVTPKKATPKKAAPKKVFAPAYKGPRLMRLNDIKENFPIVWSKVEGRRGESTYAITLRGDFKRRVGHAAAAKERSRLIDALSHSPAWTVLSPVGDEDCRIEMNHD
jgi:hypothetical protein